MIIFFGWGKQTVKELGTTDKIRCGHCGNVREWEYKKITTWFTLFFIPVIPYKIDYIKQCRICNVAARIDKEEASPGDSGSISSKDEDSGLTDVQKNYRDEMAALKKE